MLKDFRDFALRGNMIDLAVGVIIGAAFNSVVSSLVDDIIMPPIGALLGNIDFSQYYINLSGGSYDSLAAAQDAGAATIDYGLFINNIISFLIVAFAVFLLVRAVKRAEETIARGETKPDEGPPDTKQCPYCFTMIPYQAVRCPNCTTQLEGSS
jgi:large conductance mechanosensitive channel